MRTIFGNELRGYAQIGYRIFGNDFRKNNQLLRCMKHKKIEGEYLLSLPQNHSFLDIGAHCGDTILTMALYALKNNRADIRFFAFEPNIKKCELIQKVAEKNKLTIKIYNCCVGNINGFAESDKLIADYSGGCSYKYRDSNNDNNDNNYIKIMRLDDIQNILMPIGLMHIDTEGWELEVLKGSHQILKSVNGEGIKEGLILICECWSDDISMNEKKRGRAYNIMSETPRKDILNLINNYNFNQLDDIIDLDTNLVFKKKVCSYS